MATYRVLAGVSYPPNKRAEAGDIVDNLPSRSIKWLLEAGVIEQVQEQKPAAKRSTLIDAADPIVFDRFSEEED